MKISQFETDKGADMVCDLLPFVESIMTDKEAFEKVDSFFDDIKNSKLDATSETVSKVMTGVSILVPFLLKDHRHDVFSILSVLNEKSVEEIKKQKLCVTIREIKEAFQDEDLIALFR